MKSRGQIAASVAREKEAHPERFCPVKRCLWRTGGGFCPRHKPAPVTPALVSDACKACGLPDHGERPCSIEALAHAREHARPYSCSCVACGDRAMANGHIFGGLEGK
jgi:hypothetical protein